MTFATLSAACVAALAAACGGSTTVTEITGPSDAARCQTSVSAPSGAVPADGATLTVTVSAARECEWSAASEASWAQVTPTSGQGEAALTVSVAANPATQARSTSLVVNGQRLSLSQDAAPCRFGLSGTSRMSHAGGRAGVTVSATDGCSWRATSDAGWARVVRDSGTGPGTVELDIAPNTGSTARTARIAVEGEAHSLTQDPAPSGGNPAPDPEPEPDPGPPGGSCTPSIDDDDQSFGASGGSGSFRVNAPGQCEWRATTGASWIRLSNADGRGNGTVSYTVERNASPSSRSGTISVGSRTHTVRQDGEPAPPPPGEDDDDDEEVELSGRAWLLSGSCPNISFSVDWRRVFTTGDTRFRGGACSDLRPGTEVEVKGRPDDGRIRAGEVRLRRD
jgi:hypothetical protein